MGGICLLERGMPIRDLKELFKRMHNLSDEDAETLATYIKTNYSTKDIADELGIPIARVTCLMNGG